MNAATTHDSLTRDDVFVCFVAFAQRCAVVRCRFDYCNARQSGACRVVVRSSASDRLHVRHCTKVTANMPAVRSAGAVVGRSAVRSSALPAVIRYGLESVANHRLHRLRLFRTILCCSIAALLLKTYRILSLALFLEGAKRVAVVLWLLQRKQSVDAVQSCCC